MFGAITILYGHFHILSPSSNVRFVAKGRVTISIIFYIFSFNNSEREGSLPHSRTNNSPCVLCPRRVAVRHVKVKPRCGVLTMLKRLDRIRFRGPRTRDDFPDLAESPPASDNECSDDMQLKPRTALRDTEEILRDPVSAYLAYTRV